MYKDRERREREIEKEIYRERGGRDRQRGRQKERE